MAKALQLHATKFGLAVGIIWAAGVFLLGLFAMGGWAVPIVTLIGSGYLGYAASITGSIVGAIWGFVDGFIGGFLVAWLYNKLL